MEISKIIQKVRFKAQDVNEVKFSDYEVVLAITEANKAFRTICMQEAPNVIARNLEGTIGEETNAIALGKTAKVLNIMVGDRKLYPAIKPIDGIGTPQVFSLSNNDEGLCLNVYPKPKEDLDYNVKVIDESPNLTVQDELKLPEECIGFIVDVSVNMLNGGDGITQSALEEKLRYILGHYIPDISFVKSYY